MSRFQPSDKSYASIEEIAFMRSALDIIEAHLSRGEIPPAWVAQKVSRAVTELGLAASYLTRKERA